jgi:L-ribulose-5-phosphate 4-epimerase
MSVRSESSVRDAVWEANQAIVRAGLVTLSFGNASGLDRDRGLLVIKPSGVAYRTLRPEDLVVIDLEDGRIVEGSLRPSSDTPTHLASSTPIRSRRRRGPRRGGQSRRSVRRMPTISTARSQ